MKVIFLDIDGVLNGHHYMREAQSCNICRPCVLQLNRIIRRTGAKVVLSSAWRYMVHGGAMTLRGFGYMLRTHGMTGMTDTLIGLTCSDEDCHECGHRHRRRDRMRVDERGRASCVKCGAEQDRDGQIRQWLRERKAMGLCVDSYVVIDDDDLGFTRAGLPFVQTDAKRGLTRRKADEAIAILGATA